MTCARKQARVAGIRRRSSGLAAVVRFISAARKGSNICRKCSNACKKKKRMSWKRLKNLRQNNRRLIMILNKIKCEAVKVNTESGICPGLAKTGQGETFVIGVRTPDAKGICCQALSAISPMRLAMSYTDKLSWETKEYFDITCPHGVVTYRLSRIKEDSPAK